jgi:hypothetical protein
VGELICVGSVSTTTPNVFEDDDNPHPALLWADALNLMRSSYSIEYGAVQNADIGISQ